MADNIAQVVIPAHVIQLNNSQFIEDGAIVPQVLEVPCQQTHIDLSTYWAIPTKDNGIFTGWQYQPTLTETGKDIPKPTYDSFEVLRIRDKISGYTWWLGNSMTQYTENCNACCDGDTTPLTFDPPIIAPCQNICDATNDDGNYYVVFAAPTLGDSEQYVVNGAFDNVNIAEFTSTDLDDLITDLNANFTNVGDASPPYSIVWTRDGNTIIGTIQGGFGLNSSLCLVITTELT